MTYIPKLIYKSIEPHNSQHSGLPFLASVSRQMVLLLVFTGMIAHPLGAEAKKDKTKKKVELAAFNYEPDPICKRAKPDSHPRHHEPPTLAYFGGGGGPHLEGFDISHYQGHIDWSLLSTDPHAGFIYLKMTEGGNIVDNTYQYNISEARRAGVKVGSYHFFRANTSAREQFENFKSVFDPRKQDLLPVIDVEVMPGGISKSRFDACLEELLMLIEKEYGRKAVIYTGKNFYNKHFHGTKFTRTYKFWIAAYADDQPVLDSNDDYLIWQYSAKGKARGIKGYVDTNRFVGRHVIGEIRY